MYIYCLVLSLALFYVYSGFTVYQYTKTCAAALGLPKMLGQLHKSEKG